VARRLFLCPLIIAGLVCAFAAKTRAQSATNALPQPPKIVATIFGKPIFADEPEPSAKIWQPLIDRYVAENRLEPTEAEVKQFNQVMSVRRADSIEKFRRQRKELTERLRSTQLSDHTRSNLTSQVTVLDNILKMEVKPGGFEAAPEVTKQVVRMWKFNKSLYEKYGGRVIFQQAGIEPLDGYKQFLEEQEAKGAFQISDAGLRAKFWEYFTTMRHTEVHVEDPFGKPWWLLEKAPEEEPRQTAPTRIEEASVTGTGLVASLSFRVSLEDNAPGKIKLELKGHSSGQETVRALQDIQPGPVTLDLRGLDIDHYLLWASSPGYATQWLPLDIKRGKAVLGTTDMKLYRKRYVICRYVVNTAGKRGLRGADVAEGRCAAAHWGQVPHFGADWQVWQRGDKLYLDFHRYSPNFGFAPPAQGIPFDDLQEAPENDQYECKNTPAEKGSVLFCRVQGNGPRDRCYGKIFIEDVTETPPPNITVIESGH
jgi:hypothetical protein